MIGDGQVTQGSYVVKDNAKKVRTLQNGKILTGFAGAAVDALALFDRLESKLDQYPELMRACVELAKEWRSDKSLRRTLNAVMVVADKDLSLTISGASSYEYSSSLLLSPSTTPPPPPDHDHDL